MDHLAGSVEDTGGVYFVTAFSGLLAPLVALGSRDPMLTSTGIGIRKR